MTDKAEIRSRLRAQRRALTGAQQEDAAQAVLARLRALDAYREARCVMAYAAARGELSLAPVIADLLGRGCTLALPRCEAPGIMTARQVASKDQLCAGAFGLDEPLPACRMIEPQEIDLILVPGAAFGRDGGRIGQGGGYYDRFLPETRALRVGICHEFALMARVPACAHDQRMDMVITPQETAIISRCRRKHE